MKERQSGGIHILLMRNENEIMKRCGYDCEGKMFVGDLIRAALTSPTQCNNRDGSDNNTEILCNWKHAIV